VCGRYSSSRSAGQLADWFDADDDTAGALAPREELAPTDPVPIVRRVAGADRRTVAIARWGLLPPWVADRRAASRMINARAETVRTTPAYREPFARRRCLVPADGWYEWRRRPDRPGTQKYYLTSHDGTPLAFAGLWQAGRDELPATCTILTTAALGALAEVHDRMPLVLAADRWESWLDCGAPPAAELIAPPSTDTIEGLRAQPVGPGPSFTTPTLF
jgi:putative SOS response-associated peptidase YedK